jgi:hypothetical protein
MVAPFTAQANTMSASHKERFGSWQTSGFSLLAPMIIELERDDGMKPSQAAGVNREIELRRPLAAPGGACWASIFVIDSKPFQL